nr:unnamed protein product [Sorex araneus]
MAYITLILRAEIWEITSKAAARTQGSNGPNETVPPSLSPHVPTHQLLKGLSSLSFIFKDCNNGCLAEYAGEGGSKDAWETFKAKDLVVTPASILKAKPDPSTLVFGTVFTDHMLTVEWSLEFGWEKPHIKPLQNLSLHPGSSVLHYAVELFEGLKAFRGVDGKIRLFRPKLNMERMHRSATRATLPPFFQSPLTEHCPTSLCSLGRCSQGGSFHSRLCSLSLQPSLGVKKPTKALIFVILSPVGPYFASGTFNPVSLWANPKYIRAWKGGTGHCKMGGNYASSLFAQCEAAENGCQQVLWLYGEDNQITEVGTMNLFLYWTNEDGGRAPLPAPPPGTSPPLTGYFHLQTVRWELLTVGSRLGATARPQQALRVDLMSDPQRVVLTTLHIPTMDHGPKLASRILEKLTDIQYGREESDWTELVS